MDARAFVWIGGGLFAAALGTTGWCYIFVFGRSLPFAGWQPILLDAALLTIFAAHHSIFARERVKAELARRLPAPLLRSVYVWVASLLLILVCVLWQPIGGTLYTVAGVAALACTAIQLAGVFITARAVARIDPLELAGIHPAAHGQGLQVTGPYRWVRHPLYLGWWVMVFGAAHMTGDRLAFAAITTFYLMIAIPWEERSLERSFGDAYARYKRDVRWRMIPFIY